MQPSEIDRLSTYEFTRYNNLLEKQIEQDREREEQLAQISGTRRFLGL